MKERSNCADAPGDSPEMCDPGSLTDAELLVCFLGIEAPSDEALHLATSLLTATGGLRGLGRAASGTDLPIPGCRPAWITRLRLARELARRQLLESIRRGPGLTSPADTVEFLRTALGDRRREIFTCLFLDTRHRVLASEELFQGSIDGACVYPRVVAERALRLGAAAVIVAHNHPSGVSEPSLADQAITRRLKEALALLEIRLLDHFVIGDDMPVSMASRGML
ncbi:MAG: DNA repair protein RadC [Xanthomonadales bacterium]|nr:DNA repair protein RadC [Xanthomonadales bacterium]NIX12726.1 DNA repair protein RadC [Xanthomonadales bacterium]